MQLITSLERRGHILKHVMLSISVPEMSSSTRSMYVYLKCVLSNLERFFVYDTSMIAAPPFVTTGRDFISGDRLIGLVCSGGVGKSDIFLSLLQLCAPHSIFLRM